MEDRSVWTSRSLRGLTPRHRDSTWADQTENSDLEVGIRFNQAGDIWIIIDQSQDVEAIEEAEAVEEEETTMRETVAMETDTATTGDIMRIEKETDITPRAGEK